MRCWHQHYKPKLHRYKYLHGSVMMANGYCRWVVWWDNGYNWNWLYTGDGYHSTVLKICDQEDVQGFSDIPKREQVNFITDTMEYGLDNSKEKDPQDRPTNAKLAYNQTNPHVESIHFNTVTLTKVSTPTQTVWFDMEQPINNLFRFSTPKLKKKKKKKKKRERENNQ